MSKKVKNDEKMSDIAQKRPKVVKNEKNNIFCIFSGKYGKMSKKVKMMKKSHILMKQTKIDEKMKKIIFFGFFQQNMKKCRKK